MSYGLECWLYWPCPFVASQTSKVQRVSPLRYKDTDIVCVGPIPAFTCLTHPLSCMGFVSPPSEFCFFNRRLFSCGKQALLSCDILHTLPVRPFGLPCIKLLNFSGSVLTCALSLGSLPIAICMWKALILSTTVRLFVEPIDGRVTPV